jgi:hypothetical protein
MTKDEEIALVQAVIDAPAGFALDLFCGLLTVYRQGESIKVEWNEPVVIDGVQLRAERNKTFQGAESRTAAELFVEKRHELSLGIDLGRYDVLD